MKDKHKKTKTKQNKTTKNRNKGVEAIAKG